MRAADSGCLHLAVCVSHQCFSVYNTESENWILYLTLFYCTEQCFHTQNRVLMIRNKEESLKGRYESTESTLPKYTVMRKKHTGVQSYVTHTVLFFFFQMSRDQMFQPEAFIKQPGKEYLLCLLWSNREFIKTDVLSGRLYNRWLILNHTSLYICDA